MVWSWHFLSESKTKKSLSRGKIVCCNFDSKKLIYNKIQLKNNSHTFKEIKNHNSILI